MILFLDTEFTCLTREMQLLSLALVSADGKLEFYGERDDVPVEHCSRFVVDTVLPLMEGSPPVACNFLSLRSRVRSFFDELPERSTIACDSAFDMDLLTWLVGRPWPNQLYQYRLDLTRMSQTAAFIEAQASCHDARRPWHHALHDARALRAGYVAWDKLQNK